MSEHDPVLIARKAIEDARTYHRENAIRWPTDWISMTMAAALFKIAGLKSHAESEAAKVASVAFADYAYGTDSSQPDKERG